jgi:hypothetical protein
MFWRRPEPEISHEEVIEIIDALADIKAWTWDILAILSQEDDDEPKAP